MRKHEILNDSGDVGLKARGSNLEELFENAASGMSELITDISGIAETERKEVVLRSETIEDLLVSWLNEIIFLFDAYQFVGKKFSVSMGKNRLTAMISGGFFDPYLHEKRLLIKAATYHNLTVRKNSFWEATVLFDI
jgi:SHS2 domain-containing protein